jgi:2-hydroxy-6-oxonona-2,4-dienedioate hydrolase
MTQSPIDNSPLDAADTSRFVAIDGAKIHYNVVKATGDASPIPIVFTHGGGPGSSSWNNFLYNARALSRRYTCYFYDLPGFGGSDCVPVQGGMHSWQAGKFLKFIDALKIDKAHLVNQSLGGSMAIKAATMAPNRIDHLVITGSRPVVGGMMGPVSMTQSRQAIKAYYDNPSVANMRSLIATLEFHDPGKLTDLNVQSRYALSVDPNIQKYMADPANRGTPESLVEVFREVKARTLVVHGLHDVFGFLDVPIVMINQFADARLHLIGNAAHHVQTECPNEYNAVVSAFLP